MLTSRIHNVHDLVALTCGGGVFQFKSKEGSISPGWSICATILSNSEFRSCKLIIVLSRCLRQLERGRLKTIYNRVTPYPFDFVVFSD